MKRMFAALMAFTVLFSLCGCIRTTPTEPSQTNPGENTTETVPTQTQTHPTINPTTHPTTHPTTVPTVPPTTAIPTTLPLETTKPKEPQIPATEYSKNALVRVKDYIPDIVVELRYAGENNHAERAIYDFQDAYLRYGTVKKLMQVQEALKKEGYGLKIWDAYRPVGAQYALWQATPNANYVENPAWGLSEHTQGDTLDVTLVDLNGNEIDMPSDYDTFSALANCDYTDCTQQQKANVLLLQNTMKKFGFLTEFSKWWHFNDKDPYSNHTAFDPGAVSLWYANCQEYLTLRKTPYVNGDPIGKVNAGQTVTVMGWHEKFAFVEYKGMQGYVLPDYLAPESQWVITDMLSVVKPTDTYTYKQMQKDIASLAAKYPNFLQVGSIGKSELGRDLILLKVGDPNAKKHVIIHAAIHAREHMTTWTVMATVEYWLSQNMAGCEDTLFHIIPMLNPDGVHLAQTGSYTELQQQIYQNDKNKGNTGSGKWVYAATWKANGLGVDLNRNFDAAWDITFSRGGPSSERYKGESPCSAAEAAALADYTLALMPDATISYHSTSSIIYYEYGSKKGINAESKSLGQAVLAVTGYPLIGQSGLDAGGYKDWCMDALQIPSLTIEIGVNACPMPEREVHSLFARNLRVLPAIARWVQENT
jgi:D-alanyl-D-alanine dipeptidase/predicted small lipoprotein YifL